MSYDCLVLTTDALDFMPDDRCGAVVNDWSPGFDNGIFKGTSLTQWRARI